MRYLFERLAHPVASSAEFDVRAAVQENVQRLLANRVLPDPETESREPDVLSCGLPSVVDLPRDSRPALEDYGDRIRRLIEHYEPRLAGARVEIEPAGGASPFRLVIAARLAAAQEADTMRFPVSSHEG